MKQNMLSRVPTPRVVYYNAGFGIYVTPLGLLSLINCNRFLFFISESWISASFCELLATGSILLAITVQLASIFIYPVCVHFGQLQRSSHLGSLLSTPSNEMQHLYA